MTKKLNDVQKKAKAVLTGKGKKTERDATHGSLRDRAILTSIRQGVRRSGRQPLRNARLR